MSRFMSIATPAHAVSDPIKGSRFLGDIAPATTESEAQHFIQTIRGREPSANHHCYAWRLADGRPDWRAWDDGEPGGTAGLPILARIDGTDLLNVVVVITRYFGGTKLGKGGLIRAYGNTARLAIDAADIVECVQTSLFTLQLDYADLGSIQGVLSSMNWTPKHEHYGARVQLDVAVPIEEIPNFTTLIQDKSAGRVQPRLVQPSSNTSFSE